MSTPAGEPKKTPLYDAHKALVLALGPQVAEALASFRRDLNAVMARGVQRLFAIAAAEYRRMLDKHGVLDFSDVLERALALLEQRDDFSRCCRPGPKAPAPRTTRSPRPSS